VIERFPLCWTGSGGIGTRHHDRPGHLRRVPAPGQSAVPVMPSIIAEPPAAYPTRARDEPPLLCSSAHSGCGSSRRAGPASPTWARSTATACRGCAQGRQGRTRPAAARGSPSDRPRRQRPRSRSDPAQHARRPDGPPRRHPAGSNTWPPPPESTCPGCTPHAPHTFVSTMLDAGVILREVQIAARHADRAPPCATTAPADTSTACAATPVPRYSGGACPVAGRSVLRCRPRIPR
jgi:hypothetical protein